MTLHPHDLEDLREAAHAAEVMAAAEAHRERTMTTYTIHVTYDEADDIHVATVDEYPSLSAHGDSEPSALLELVGVVATVLDDLAADVTPPPPA